MELQELTKNFVAKYVYPRNGIKEVTSNNVKTLIKYIEETFEKPLSIDLASGEEIDLDFFLSVNTVLNDLSLNSKKDKF